jgi:hypothetical protein
MIIEQKMFRTSSGLLTTDASGNASVTLTGVNGELRAVEVILGTASSCTVALADDHGVSLFSKTGVNANQRFVPGATITDGTTPRSIPIALAGDLTLTIASGGDTKTVTVLLYYR